MAVIRSILLHHHATIYTNPITGQMYTFSFIGRWVNELSTHFDKIGLLFHESDIKSDRHDTLLLSDNITIETLGAPGKAYDRFQKLARVKSACEKASNKYDILIIRGITPRQYTVFNAVKVKYKVYLLVGSIEDSKPSFKLHPNGIYLSLMYHIRVRELGKIARMADLMMANSPKVVEEIRAIFSVESVYSPTNTIKSIELRPFRNKKIEQLVKIYFCGRIVAEKGIFEFLEAVSILQEKGINCRVTLIGNVSSKIKLEFQNLPYWHKIEEVVEFTGFVQFGDSLLDLFDKHDIYVLPSYHEGFPHSIWEAAAVSTPVITTPVGGIPGILTENEVWFIPVKNARALSKKIIELIEHPEVVKIKTRTLHNLLQNNTLESGVEQLVRSLKNCIVEIE